MRGGRKFKLLDDKGEELEVPRMKPWLPHHILVEPSWKWGPEAKEKEYRKKKFHPLTGLSVVIKDLTSKRAELFRILEIWQPDIAGNAELSLDGLNFKMLKEKVWKSFSIAAESKSVSILYFNSHWGNDALKISDNESLRIAAKTLQSRGEASLRFYVSLLIVLPYI